MMRYTFIQACIAMIGLRGTAASNVFVEAVFANIYVVVSSHTRTYMSRQFMFYIHFYIISGILISAAIIPEQSIFSLVGIFSLLTRSRVIPSNAPITASTTPTISPNSSTQASFRQSKVMVPTIPVSKASNPTKSPKLTNDVPPQSKGMGATMTSSKTNAPAEEETLESAPPASNDTGMMKGTPVSSPKSSKQNRILVRKIRNRRLRKCHRKAKPQTMNHQYRHHKVKE